MNADMKFSDAIRLGSSLVPQCFDRIFTYGSGEQPPAEPTHACAIGAAMLALGFKDEQFGQDHIGQRWPWTDANVVPCTLKEVPAVHPDSRFSYYPLAKWTVCRNLFSVGQYVAHLNDCHRWTREQIAEWVETQERKYDAAAGELAPMISASLELAATV